VREPGYTGAEVVSHSVAGAAVWTYSQGAGTYSFDTARRAWRKEDDWALPFRGKAVRDDDHAGGCGLWFGISSAPGRRLCATDLATATASSPPEVRGVWEEFRPPTSPPPHLISGGRFGGRPSSPSAGSASDPRWPAAPNGTDLGERRAGPNRAAPTGHGCRVEMAD